MPIIAKEDLEAIRRLGTVSPDVALTVDKVRSAMSTLGERLALSDAVIGQACSALNAGDHLILSGPPGTGKTTLARVLGYAASDTEPLVTTATADWSTFDTVGGYMPDLGSAGNALVFEPGIFLRSVSERRWLVVDEINRAQIDRAIGALFTVLSKGKVTLPYRDRKSDTQISLAYGAEGSTKDAFFFPPDWRLIATMNEYDKMSLFEMSYAFQRRFAVIRIGLPDSYGECANEWAAQAGLGNAAIGYVKALATAAEEGRTRELGPAILKSIIRYLAKRQETEANALLQYAEALSMYVLPQYQGLGDREVAALWKVIGPQIGPDNDAKRFMAVNVRAMTGYELSDIENLNGQ